MTGLRTRRGVDVTRLSERASVDVAAHYAAELAKLTDAGLVERRGSYLRVTEKGLTQLNGVVAAFF